MFSWNNFDLFVSGVDVETQEKVALKLVSEVVINSHVACFVIFMIHVSIVVVHCIVVVVTLFSTFSLAS
jgi:hypothetical protein